MSTLTDRIISILDQMDIFQAEDTLRQLLARPDLRGISIMDHMLEQELDPLCSLSGEEIVEKYCHLTGMDMQDVLNEMRPDSQNEYF